MRRAWRNSHLASHLAMQNGLGPLPVTSPNKMTIWRSRQRDEPTGSFHERVGVYVTTLCRTERQGCFDCRLQSLSASPSHAVVVEPSLTERLVLVRARLPTIVPRFISATWRPSESPPPSNPFSPAPLAPISNRDSYVHLCTKVHSRALRATASLSLNKVVLFYASASSPFIWLTMATLH